MLLFTHSTTPCDKLNSFFVLPGMRVCLEGTSGLLGCTKFAVIESSTLRPLVPSSVQPPAVFVCRLHALPGSSRGRSNIIQPRGPQCVASNQSLRKYSRGRNALTPGSALLGFSRLVQCRIQTYLDFPWGLDIPIIASGIR